VAAILLQLGAHQRLPGFVETAPASERRDQPRRGLRVELLHLENRVRKETVAAARRIVKSALVGGEGTDEGPHPVGVGQGEIRVAGKRFHLVQRIVRVERACTVNHLSSTSASSRYRSWKPRSAASR
jgi:hypothetical protein